MTMQARIPVLNMLVEMIALLNFNRSLTAFAQSQLSGFSIISLLIFSPYAANVSDAARAAAPAPISQSRPRPRTRALRRCAGALVAP